LDGRGEVRFSRRVTVYDVAIIGAGPAGSGLAIACATRGHRVLLLDRAEFPRPKVCGDFVSPKGLALLSRLGCLEEVLAIGSTPVRRAEAIADGRWLCESDIPHMGDMPDHALVVPREDLDEIVLRRAVSAGAEPALGCRVTSFETRPRAVEIDAEQGGRRRRFSARLIVGADGAHSVVARRAGMRMRDPRYRLHALRAYCRGLPLEHAVMSFDEEFLPGYAWIFPVRAGLANVGVGVCAETARRFGLDPMAYFRRFATIVNARAAERGVALEWERPLGFPIHSFGGAHANVFERGLLIGEAGCFVDPVSGEGIPLAIETALLAAETLDAALRAGDFSAGFLGRYERAWRDRYEVDLGLADLLLVLTRNRHLVKLWMQAIRWMGETAQRDSGYAHSVGGVLGGIFPHWRALAPDVLWRPVTGGPAPWLRSLGLAGSPSFADLAQLGASYASWGLRSLPRAAADARWLLSWWSEVARKQPRVAAAFAEATRSGTAPREEHPPSGLKSG
jgi:geranylgeranyl reductase family protein